MYRNLLGLTEDARYGVIIGVRSAIFLPFQDLGLVIIDYLQLMQAPTEGENRATEISAISRSLKSLAKELNVPVVALSQLNRSLEQRPNKRPVMSDLRESGAIEQDADIVMFIYRDDYGSRRPIKITASFIDKILKWLFLRQVWYHPIKKPPLSFHKKFRELPRSARPT